MIKHRYLSRSALSVWQRCPRQGYLSQSYKGKGIAPIRKTAPLSIGTANHAGVEVLLKGLKDGSVSVDRAIDSALGVYAQETVLGVANVPDRFRSIVEKEHHSLIEASLRLYAVHRLPIVDEKYEILEVEAEHTIPFTDSLTLISRPDAVFEDRFSGMLDVFSLKNPGAFDYRKNKDATVDMQGLSESFAVQHDYPNHEVKGVMMEHIVVGKSKDVEVEDGLEEDYPIRTGPLVRGYMRPSPTGEGYQFAWKGKIDNPNFDPAKPRKTGNFKQTTLTVKQGWNPIASYEVEGGVKVWIDLLTSGTMLPLGVNPAHEIFEYPPPYIRKQEHIDEWVLSTIVEQTLISEKLARLEAGDLTLAQAFPKYSHSCMYPSRCPFYEVCWKGHSADDEKVFTVRVPHHSQEVEDPLNKEKR